MPAHVHPTLQLLGLALATASALRPTLVRGTPARAVTRAAVPPEPAFAVRASASLAEDWQSAELLHRCFGGPTLTYLASLKSPVLNANVFFRPTADPEVVVAVADGTVLGVAQVMRVTLQAAAGVGEAGRTVAYVQSVAVAEGHRRCGLATALMVYCETRALEAWGDDAAQMWLALGALNGAARPLYEARGFERRSEGSRSL